MMRLDLSIGVTGALGSVYEKANDTHGKNSTFSGVRIGGLLSSSFWGTV